MEPEPAAQALQEILYLLNHQGSNIAGSVRFSSVAPSCPTLSDPMDCSPPGSSILGIFQARVLEWGAIAFSEHLRQIDIYKYLLIINK